MKKKFFPSSTTFLRVASVSPDYFLQTLPFFFKKKNIFSSYFYTFSDPYFYLFQKLVTPLLNLRPFQLVLKLIRIENRFILILFLLLLFQYLLQTVSMSFLWKFCFLVIFSFRHFLTKLSNSFFSFPRFKWDGFTEGPLWFVFFLSLLFGYIG